MNRNIREKKKRKKDSNCIKLKMGFITITYSKKPTNHFIIPLLCLLLKGKLTRRIDVCPLYTGRGRGQKGQIQKKGIKKKKNKKIG